MPANKVHAWAFVAMQAVLLALLVFIGNDIGPTITKVAYAGTALEWLGFLGIILSAISIRTSLTALPLPKENARLGTNGLYRYVRHPMYTSVIILALGIALLSGSVLKYGLVVSLVLLFYYKSVYEERYLRLKYPEYQSYASRTPRLIPFIKNIRSN